MRARKSPRTTLAEDLPTGVPRCGRTPTAPAACPRQTRSQRSCRRWSIYATVGADAKPRGSRALVTGLVLGRLAQPDAASALARSDDGQAQQATDKAAATRARLDTAADAYADGSIDGAQLARITAKLRPELLRWQELARAASTAPDLLDLATPDIAQRWQALPLARQRAVIDLLLDIAVLPATRAGGHGGFDPDSIRITWKPTT